MYTNFVYIMSSYRGTLYVGVTDDLPRRVMEHKLGKASAFTAKYNVNRLVHYEQSDNIVDAIAREKQIKGWTRIKKVRLIEADNPHWEDLSKHLLDPDMLAELRQSTSDHLSPSRSFVARSSG